MCLRRLRSMVTFWQFWVRMTRHRMVACLVLASIAPVVIFPKSTCLFAIGPQCHAWLDARQISTADQTCGLATQVTGDSGAGWHRRERQTPRDSSCLDDRKPAT